MPVYSIKNTFEHYINKFLTKKSKISGVFDKKVENYELNINMLKKRQFLSFLTNFKIFTLLLVEKS